MHVVFDHAKMAREVASDDTRVLALDLSDLSRDLCLPVEDDVSHLPPPPSEGAVRWIAQQGDHSPGAVEEAARRFDLSPVDEEFLLRPRMSRIFYRGKFYDYPLKAFNALGNLGIIEAIRWFVGQQWKPWGLMSSSPSMLLHMMPVPGIR